jgi:hypothetical protein
MIGPPAKFLRKHTVTENSTNYTPAFTDLSGFGSSNGSVGSWTPLYYGVHNYSAAQTISVWTVEQGTAGTGVSVYVAQGDTFYANISKLTVGTSGPVTLLGTTNTQVSL